MIHSGMTMENTFPIDFVVPMVFPDDPAWQRDYERARGDYAGAAVRNVRWRSWGTEELMVRCVLKYMPWVRSIFILLASETQEQEWMRSPSCNNGMTELRVVRHREFIPEKFLPCFSSPCIEMFLHRIPGLSEQFIYGNDDMFPLSPLSPDDFFRSVLPSSPEGALPCQVMAEKPFPPSPNIFQRKCMYQQNMVGAPFGRKFRRTWLKSGHSFAPILKSSCEEVWRRHGGEIERNISPLRRTDRSYNHYIYLLYQYFSGITVGHAPRKQYVGRGTPTAQIAGIIREPDAGILCLNDNENIDDWERRAAVVRREISAKLAKD